MTAHRFRHPSLAWDLAEILDRAASDAHALTAHIHHEQAHELASELDFAAHDARASTTNGGPSLIMVLGRVDRAAEMARALAADIERQSELASATRAVAIDVLSEVIRVLRDIGDNPQIFVSFRESDGGTADGLLMRTARVLRRAQGQNARERRSVTARRLLMVASRILPPADRARYGEEFRSELADITRAGGGRRIQLAYAVRQVMHAGHTRTVLRAPRRRSAVP